MEVDEGLEVTDVGDSTGALLDQGDFGVDGLQRGGGQAMATEREDVIQMPLEHVRDFHHLSAQLAVRTKTPLTPRIERGKITS